MSQIEYLILGTIGLPVFAGGASGLAYLLGPTGGYLFGFMLAAYLLAWLREVGSRGGPLARWSPLCKWAPPLDPTYLSMLGILIIYLVGASWLAVWLKASTQQTWLETLSSAWRLGVLPFVSIDIVKAMLAAGMVKHKNTRT